MRYGGYQARSTQRDQTPACTNLCVSFPFPDLTERFCGVENAVFSRILVTETQYKWSTCTSPTDITHTFPGPTSSTKPSSRSAILVLRLTSPSKGCNLHGVIDPQRHTWPSTTQRLQRTILEPAVSMAAPSRTHEPAQRNAVRNISPPQNEHGV